MSAGPVVNFVNTVLDRCEPSTDRFNPILVKEVRQFLRGRGFWWTFTAMVVLGAVVGVMYVVQNKENPSPVLGRELLTFLFGILSLGMLVLIPLQAFQSLGAEWEGDTMDQLLLSGLTPGKVVSGKLQSAALQSMLMVAAFGPFVALCFLMRGVDLIAMLFLVAMIYVISLWATVLALALSSLVRPRMLRGLLLFLAGIGLFFVFLGVMAAVNEIQRNPSTLRESEFIAVAGTTLLAGTCVALFGYYFTCGRLAHDEENSATPLRVVTIVSALAVVVWMGLSASQSLLPTDAYPFLAANLAVFLGLLGILWSTERPRLGRRVANDLSRVGSRTRRLPSFMLPGGGRGIAFGYLSVGGAAVVSMLASGPGDWSLQSPRWFGLLVLCYYSFFVGIPTALMARLCTREIGTWVTRLTVVVIVAAGVLVPMVVGLLIDDNELLNARCATNVVWVLDRSFSGRGSQSMALSVMALGLLGLAIGSVRIVKGATEVGRARSGRAAESDPAILRSRERGLQGR